MTIEVYFIILKERLHVITCEIEFGFDDAALCARLNHSGFSTSAKEQTDSSQQDARASSRLTSDYRESTFELHSEFADEGVILYDEGLQHSILDFLPISVL